MLKKATEELYGNFPYDIKLKYSAKFKPFRANVRLINNSIQFSLSKQWKPVSKEIQIGLIQELLLKVLKNRLKPLKKQTENIELYNIFMKKVHLGIPKTKTDPILENSFNRVNEKYFHNLIEMPNLEWSDSISKLGSYEFGTDIIAISNILKGQSELLDYVMYHEMLHKKQKFYSKNGRNYHHTYEFRKKEKEFENQETMEKGLKNLIRIKRTNPMKSFKYRTGFFKRRKNWWFL